MQPETITFQLATHYLPKVALRLECLFATIEEAYREKHPIIHHYALRNILEIMKLAEKPELKSRFLKELVRIEHVMNKSTVAVPDDIYANLFVQVQFLNHAAGSFGEGIQNDQFLQSIRFAQTIDNSDVELHSPQLLLWLEQSAELRQQNLITWFKQLQSLHTTVTIYLSLLRSSADFKKINLLNGFYQCPLPAKNYCHLILLRMDKNSGLVPKMQLGHHGLSLRLCESDSINQLRHSDMAVDLAICVL